jgi:hypothetical protein
MRALDRQDHITLPNKDPDLVSRVLFGFFNSYSDTLFDNQFKKNFTFDRYFPLDMTNQNNEVMLP